MLFEVDTADGKLEFGGFPYHFIVNPVKKANVADVRRVSNNSLVGRGHSSVIRARSYYMYNHVSECCLFILQHVDFRR